jgi:PAS domain S-box-containing protein
MGSVTPVLLQLAWKHQFEFAGFYAAVEQGYYQDLGLEVKIREYQKNLNLVEEVVSGRAQYGISDSSLILDRSHGDPVVLLANIFQHSPVVLLSQADTNIYSPAQMIGKRIMLSTDKENNASIIAMLNSESVSLEQLDVRPHSFNIEDFINGKVEIISAYITNEPGVLKERKVKFNIIDPINYGFDFYGDNIFTSEKELRDHPEQVDHFVKASLKGWQYALEHPDEMIQLILTKYSSDKSLEALAYEAKALQRFILHKHIPLGTVDSNRMGRIVDIYKQLKMLPKAFNLEGFIYQPENADDLSLNLSEEQKHWIKQHPQVIIGVDPARPPFEFIDEQGNYSGIAAEYIQLIEEKTGLDFVVQNNPSWKSVMENARSGKLDLLPAVMKSPQRSKFLDFTRPHINYPMVIVTGKDDAFIGSLKELDHKQVAVVKGYVTEDILRANHPGIKLKPAENLQQALKILASGEVDALVDNLASVSYTISQLGINNLRISGTTPYDFALGIAAPKQHEILLSIIQKTLHGISKEERKKITDKWISVTYQQSPDYEKIIKISIATLVFIVFILFWNWRLAREIKARKIAEQALKENQQILEYRNNILELLSKGTQLKTILEVLIQHLEQSHPLMIGSVLLADKQKKRLIDGVAVSLADDYMQAIDGIKICMGAGSCGTAAYTGERVIVEDIMTHPYWQSYRELTQKEGLRACWSEPILSSTDEVLGAFAIYYREPKAPNEADLKLIHDFSILATFVIENYQSNELLKKLSFAIDQIANVVIITNKAGIIEYVNPKFVEVTGYQQEEAIGQTPHLLKSNKTDIALYNDLWRTLLSGKRWQGEFCNRKKNGELYWAWDNVAPILNNEGEITHFVAVQEDITARREAEEAIRNSETRFRNLVENTNIVAWEVEIETFEFNYVSPQAEAMFGYPCAEWLRKDFWANHIVDQDREKSVAFCISETKKGRDHTFEYRMKKANGDYIWIRDIVTVNKDAEGKPISLSGVFIDIDEGKRYEQALEKAKLEAEQANKIKSEFLATMSHELRTPMNGVLGMAQLLEETELTAQQRQSVEIILRSGSGLLSIINDVLDLSKLDAEQLVLEARNFNLERICVDALNMFIPEGKHKNLQIKLDYPEYCPRNFIGDSLRLQQILINLLGNAVKFTPEGSVRLIVKCHPLANQRAELTLSVQDTGIGIAAEKIATLFDPFIQAAQTTTREFGGTGLGLSVSKKLIQLMAGDIGVESELGKGTTFWIQLSVRLADEQLIPENQHPISIENSTLAGKVLLVEDDKTNQLVALGILRTMGLEVELAEDGQQAVMACQKKRYDLILMDCRMPVMDGYEATKIIRTQQTGLLTPIIALTANSSPENRKRCLDAGMDNVITKPFKKEGLFYYLREWLASDSQTEGKQEDLFMFLKESPASDNQNMDEQSVATDIKPPANQNLTTNQSLIKETSLDFTILEKFRIEMKEDYNEILVGILQGFDTFFTRFDKDSTHISDMELARSAHNLKSRSAHLGAIKLCKIADEIEKLADKKELTQAKIKIHQLRQEYEYVLAELTKVE